MLAGNPYHRVLPTSRPKKSSVQTSKKEVSEAKNCKVDSDGTEVLDYISNVGIIAKKSNIVTVKVGVKNLIPKVDFDRIMSERLAQYGSYSIV